MAAGFFTGAVSMALAAAHVLGLAAAASQLLGGRRAAAVLYGYGYCPPGGRTSQQRDQQQGVVRMMGLALPIVASSLSSVYLALYLLHGWRVAVVDATSDEPPARSSSCSAPHISGGGAPPPPPPWWWLGLTLLLNNLVLLYLTRLACFLDDEPVAGAAMSAGTEKVEARPGVRFDPTPLSPPDGRRPVSTADGSSTDEVRFIAGGKRPDDASGGPPAAEPLLRATNSQTRHSRLGNHATAGLRSRTQEELRIPTASSTGNINDGSPRHQRVSRPESVKWQGGVRLQNLARMAQMDTDKPEADDGGVSMDVEILHVDDDPVQHFILSKRLKRYVDTTVTKVTSGEEALTLLEDRFSETGSVESFPTLIVMDQMMMGMDGTKAARRIRELYPQALMPIIITSSVEADKIRSTADYQASGVNDVITKPMAKISLTSTLACQINLANLQRSNSLLRSILPPSIISRLIAGQKVIADKHECVSILFTDIVGYTCLSAKTTTPDLIQILNSMFTAFDRLTDKHGVYKVETIGDAYMAAAGHSDESAEDHVQRLITMAQDMIKATAAIELPDGSNLEIRVGIHTGPAYAGVVGEKCPRYCFFGDTVNTASRMESTSFPQCIQISESTYSHVATALPESESKDSSDICCISLGTRAVKGKGEMQTYLVKAGEWQSVLKSRNADVSAESVS